eukprot:1170460-Rhodomonas_salina.2
MCALCRVFKFTFPKFAGLPVTRSLLLLCELLLRNHACAHARLGVWRCCSLTSTDKAVIRSVLTRCHKPWHSFRLDSSTGCPRKLPHQKSATSGETRGTTNSFYLGGGDDNGSVDTVCYCFCSVQTDTDGVSAQEEAPLLEGVEELGEEHTDILKEKGNAEFKVGNFERAKAYYSAGMLAYLLVRAFAYREPNAWSSRSTAEHH